MKKKLRLQAFLSGAIEKTAQELGQIESPSAETPDVGDYMAYDDSQNQQAQPQVEQEAEQNASPLAQLTPEEQDYLFFLMHRYQNPNMYR